jgi:hypothetical protein
LGHKRYALSAGITIGDMRKNAVSFRQACVSGDGS